MGQKKTFPGAWLKCSSRTEAFFSSNTIRRAEEKSLTSTERPFVRQPVNKPKILFALFNLRNVECAASFLAIAREEYTYDFEGSLGYARALLGLFHSRNQTFIPLVSWFAIVELTHYYQIWNQQPKSFLQLQ